MSTKIRGGGTMDIGIYNPEQARRELEQKVEEKQALDKVTTTAEQKNSLRKAISQLGNVATLTDKLFEMPAGRMQYITKGEAFVTGGESPKAADIAEYEDMVQADAAGLYRDLTGDNRLSDDDAQKRALPLIPRPQQARRLQLQKTSKLKFMLRKRIEMLKISPDEVDLETLGKGYEQSPEYKKMLVQGRTFGISWPSKIPKYNPKTQKLQQNEETGKYRIVPK